MAGEPEPAGPGPHGSNRAKLIEAFMALLAERSFEGIGFGDISARAGVSLAQCRAAFGSTMAILAAHSKEIDEKVLAGLDADLADELPRERLFDVLMRRLEALAAHKGAVRSLMRSARRNPPLGLALNTLAVRSMQWMLAAADINATGAGGALRAQALALLYASTLRTWVDDDDPGLARTMAVLDRELARAARCAGLLDNLCRLAPFRHRSGVGRPRYRRSDLDEEPIPA
jgi:AcrR family transcriptional regulator